MAKHKRFGVPTYQFACTKAVQRLPGLNRREKATLLALSDYFGSNGDVFPSQRTLADLIGSSTKTVQRAIEGLEQKGYLRRMARLKSGRRNRSCIFAIIVTEGQVSGLHVQAIHQQVPADLVKLSGLNKPSKHIKEHSHLWVRWVEDHLLYKMDQVIDYSETPRMISLAVVSRWLFNGHRPEDFEQALIGLLVAAEHLKDVCLRDNRKIQSWNELLVLFKAPTDSKTGETDNAELDDPLKQAFLAMMPVKCRRDPKLLFELSKFRFEQAGADLVLTSTSLMAVDRLLELVAALIQKLAKARGNKILVVYNDQLVRTFG